MQVFTPECHLSLESSDMGYPKDHKSFGILVLHSIEQPVTRQAIIYILQIWLFQVQNCIVYIFVFQVPAKDRPNKNKIVKLHILDIGSNTIYPSVTNIKLFKLSHKHYLDTSYTNINLFPNVIQLNTQLQLERYLTMQEVQMEKTQTRIKELFNDPLTKKLSNYHQQNSIILNPKHIFYLLMLSRQSPEEVQIDTLEELARVMEEFPPNCVEVYNQASMLTQSKQILNIFDLLVSYLLEDEQTQDSSVRKALIKLFDRFLNNNNIPVESLKRINRIITNRYYKGTLNAKGLSDAVDLIIKIYQKSLKVFNKQRFQYFYFLGNKDEVKVLLNNNKWPFIKGLTFATWFYFQQCSPKLHPQSIIFSLTTQDSKKIQIIIIKDQIYVTCSKGEEGLAKILIGKIQFQKWNYIYLQLQPHSGSLFTSSCLYYINVRLNTHSLYKINIDLPKFFSTDIVSQIVCFRHFVGRSSSLLLTTRSHMQKQMQLQKYPYGFTSQTLIDEFVANKKESLMFLYSPCSFFEGYLLNEAREEFHGIFSGKLNKISCRQLKWYNHLDQLMPYFYMIRVIEKEKAIIFNKLLRLITQLMNEQISYQRYLFRIVYFIILDNYSCLDTQGLSIISQLHKKQQFKEVVQLVSDNMSLEKIASLKIDIPQPLRTCLGIPKKQFFVEMDKLWKTQWNKSQSFEGFWSSDEFITQKNQQCNPKEYIYDSKKTKFYNWGISNFVTKQFCRPLLEPIFIEPEYVIKSKPIIQLDNSQVPELIKYFSPLVKPEQIGIKTVPSKRQSLKQFIGVGTKPVNLQIKQQLTWKQYQTECLWINHLTAVIGILEITSNGLLCFTSNHNKHIFDHMVIMSWKNQEPVIFKWKLQSIIKIKRRRYNQLKQCIEIVFNDASAQSFHFFNKDCDVFLSKITGIKIQKTPLEHFINSSAPDHWIDRKISNFEYLMWLNFVSGRSYQDLTQYPVMPWILIFFDKVIKIDTINTYRDLSRNMGSLREESKKKLFMEKYQARNEYQLVSEYHFGTHYSSSAIICNFLIRLKPYADGAMSLQSGKFDVADRVFAHYQQSWINATTSPSDVRELIPQFYILPEMFLNLNNYDFGLTQQGQRIDNVELPVWAQGNPYKFVTMMRKALQSDIVSRGLSSWIDLIFGFKQRGKQAVDSMNIFYPFTYENSIDLDAVSEIQQRISFESQIAHFGQTPSQVIASKHPTRSQPKFKYYNRLISDGTQVKIFKNLDKEEKARGQIDIFNSVFERNSSILKVKFFKNDMYAVFKKKEFAIYKIMKTQKGEFLITKEKVHKFPLEQFRKLDLKHLNAAFPLDYIHRAFLVGGYDGGFVNVVFPEDMKKSQMIKIADHTITSIASFRSSVLIGTCRGQAIIFNVTADFNFKSIEKKYDHYDKINGIFVSPDDNMFLTCSEDGRILLYNLFSYQLIRSLKNPNNSPVLYAVLSGAPLFSIIFFSRDDSKLYSYSINGQYLSSLEQPNGYIFEPRVVKNSGNLDTLIYMSSGKCLMVHEMPFLQTKKKTQLKKNETPKISNFQCSPDGRVCVVGTVDGHLYIITDPESF